MLKKITVLLTLAFLLNSCVSGKEIIYLQNIPQGENSSNTYEPKLQPDDLLMIVVSAPDAKAAIPFNLPAASVSGTVVGEVDSAAAQARYQSYLIDNKGNIQFPVIGNMKLGGLTRAEALEKITGELKKYIKSPTVNMRIMNFQVSVTGEVNKPGEYTILTERITLLEALGLAGDMTIYGKRNKILIIREVDGKKTHAYVDLTKGDFINSPYYYLSQNDQIYVEPNKTRINSSAVGPNTSVIISAISILITIVAIVIR